MQKFYKMWFMFACDFVMFRSVNMRSGRQNSGSSLFFFVLFFFEGLCSHSLASKSVFHFRLFSVVGSGRVDSFSPWFSDYLGCFSHLFTGPYLLISLLLTCVHPCVTGFLPISSDCNGLIWHVWARKFNVEVNVCCSVSVCSVFLWRLFLDAYVCWGFLHSAVASCFL